MIVYFKNIVLVATLRTANASGMKEREKERKQNEPRKRLNDFPMKMICILLRAFFILIERQSFFFAINKMKISYRL
jgi:hypothetical protein